jgi:sugar phosphate permease
MFIWIMWACAAAFYLFFGIIRVSPAVMSDELRSAFQLDASGYAAFGAVGAYTYAILQIPAGVITDILKPRRVILTGLGLCIVSLVLLATTHSTLVAFLSRALAGVGGSVAFIAVTKINTSWFPERLQATIFALTVVFGIMGGINGQGPLLYLMCHTGWRNALLLIAALGGMIWILNLLVQRDKPHQGAVEKLTAKDLMFVFTSKDAWLFGITGLGIFLTMTVLADFWMPEFLVAKYGFTRQVASTYTMPIFIGLGVGCLVFGWLSDRFHARKPLIVVGAVSMLILTSVVIYAPNIPLWSITVMLFTMGFFCGSEMICFIAAYASLGRHLSATVAGFMNAVTMFGGAGVMHLVGVALDRVGGNTMDAAGLKIYTLADFHKAFALVIFFMILSVIGSLMIDKSAERRIA